MTDHAPAQPRGCLPARPPDDSGGLAGALWLRFNLDTIPTEYLDQALRVLPVIVVVQGANFLYFGLYRGVWRFASVPDLVRILLLESHVREAVRVNTLGTQTVARAAAAHAVDCFVLVSSDNPRR